MARDREDKGIKDMRIPDDATHYLVEARDWQLQNKKDNKNLLACLTEISDDLNQMELTVEEQEIFELGMYLGVVLGRINNN